MAFPFLLEHVAGAGKSVLALIEIDFLRNILVSDRCPGVATSRTEKPGVRKPFLRVYVRRIGRCHASPRYTGTIV